MTAGEEIIGGSSSTNSSAGPGSVPAPGRDAGCRLMRGDERAGGAGGDGTG